MYIIVFITHKNVLNTEYSCLLLSTQYQPPPQHLPCSGKQGRHVALRMVRSTAHGARNEPQSAVAHLTLGFGCGGLYVQRLAAPGPPGTPATGVIGVGVNAPALRGVRGECSNTHHLTQHQER